VLSKSDLDHSMSGIRENQLDLVPENHEISRGLGDAVNLDFLKSRPVLGIRVQNTGILGEALSKRGQEVDRALFNELLGVEAPSELQNSLGIGMYFGTRKLVNPTHLGRQYVFFPKIPKLPHTPPFGRYFCPEAARSGENPRPWPLNRPPDASLFLSEWVCQILTKIKKRPRAGEVNWNPES